MTVFQHKDLTQFKNKGIDVKTVEKQLENFRKGFPFAHLVRPATIGDGIENLNTEQTASLANYYEKTSKGLQIIKFVPASGAASRMFKDLFWYLEEYEESFVDPSDPKIDKRLKPILEFISGIKEFAFYDDLKSAMQKDEIRLEDKLKKGEYRVIIDYLLNDKGLGYGNLPKGLLKFHRHEEKSRIPLEEHLEEAALYGRSKDNFTQVHFTVSPEHLDRFAEHVDRLKPHYEKKHNLKHDITFSLQKSSTDTIAVDMENNPFIDEDGSILFRPAGHGALIENLNDLDGDLVFIKNIDNVVPDRLKSDTTLYKKAIGGLLLNLQAQTFDLLRKLDAENMDEDLVLKAIDFAKNKLNITFPEGFEKLSAEKKRENVHHRLNRPIRVCGMVKNEGEPGGGPFWVKNSSNEISLQIVESSQVDANNPSQTEILKSATHFNPVDLVCGIKNYKGEPFDLLKFVDPETGFISVKSKNGKNLKAQELPGLWNGAMAEWITLFVEVPVSTFNPVKTVNDLIRPQHRN